MSPTRTPPCIRAQRGAASLVLSALTLALCAGVLSTQYVKEQQSQRLAALDDADNTLAAAKDAVAGFIAIHGRLPCPAKLRHGEEDCGSGAKGWLPTSTLEPALSSDSGVRREAVRYAAYRGAAGVDADLAVKEDLYAPRGHVGEPVPNYGAVLSIADFCEGLRRIAPSPADGTPWQIASAFTGSLGRKDRIHVIRDAKVLNPAYGLALQQPGASEAASGLNAELTTSQLELPERPVDAQYSDHVSIVDAGELYAAMSCAPTLASLDLMADAAALAIEADLAREGNIDASDDIVIFETVLVTVQGLSALLAWVDYANLDAIAAEAEINEVLAALTGNVPGWVAATIGKIMALSGAPASLGNALSATISLAVESSNLGLYKKLGIDAKGTNVWTATEPLVKAADAEGGSL